MVCLGPSAMVFGGTAPGRADHTALLQSAEPCCLSCWDGSPQLTLSLPQLPVCGQVSLPAEPSPRGATNQLTPHCMCQQMPKAVPCQHSWLPSAACALHSHSYCLEASLLSGTWKARSLAPGLPSAPATPLRGSKVICFLCPVVRRTGSSPEPALQVLSTRLLPLPTPQAGHRHSCEGPCLPPAHHQHRVRETLTQKHHLALAILPIVSCGINVPLPPFHGCPGALHTPTSSMC